MSQPRTRLRRWGRRAWIGLAAIAVAFAVGVALRGPVCLPFDVVVNLLPAHELPALRAPDDGKTRVVFLQHGLWRTNYSLWRLERTLRLNGYEVVNTGYRSTAERIERHSQRLFEAVEARCRDGGVDEVAFVGHSLGGLVIQDYLRRADARDPFAVVYLASPHRGAMLADMRRHWFLFQFAMGFGSAQQLATVDEIHHLPILFGDRSGTLVGDVGEGNGSIPGPDDGTVGVREAMFDGARDCLRVPFSHTAITLRAAAHRQVLHFLRHLQFDPE